MPPAVMSSEADTFGSECFLCQMYSEEDTSDVDVFGCRDSGLCTAWFWTNDENPVVLAEVWR